MKFLSKRFLQIRFGALTVPALTLVTALAAGCSHSSSAEREAAFLRVLTPQVPAFLNGPAAMLLTNTTGFSARATAQSETLAQEERVRSGQLLGRGTQLFFVPKSSESGENLSRAGGFSFIWDVATHKGYVLSEALQGYAPISSTVEVTNLVWQPRAAATEKVSGRLCSVTVAQMQLNNGTGASFEVCRAPDLENLPLRITALTNAGSFSLTLSKARLEPVKVDVFTPPDGFTRYSSIEALADELAARQRILRHGNRGALEQDFERLTPTPPSRQ